MFEKAQTQIFQLMKYDSYPRFLKSDMYKDCIRTELDEKFIPDEKPTNLVRRFFHSGEFRLFVFA